MRNCWPQQNHIYGHLSPSDELWIPPCAFTVARRSAVGSLINPIDDALWTPSVGNSAFLVLLPCDDAFDSREYHPHLGQAASDYHWDCDQRRPCCTDVP